MKTDEMEIVKSVSADVGGGLILIAAYQYHTEKDPRDPEGRRNLKEKSRYRVTAVAMTKDEWLKRADSLRERAKTSLDPWKIPDDPSWDGKILYSFGNTIKDEERWLRTKLRKALPWEDALKVLAGYKKNLDAPRKSREYGKYTVFCESAVWPVDGYEAVGTGAKGSLKDPEFLKANAGRTLVLELPLKSLAAKKTARQGA